MLQAFLRLLNCLILDDSADPNNQHTKEPMHQSTGLRGWLGGMRGAIKSAAPEGEQGVMKPESQNLTNSDNF